MSERAANLGHKVKIGFLWTILGRGGNQIISFFIGIVLARLLAPEEFGIIAACLVFTEVGGTLVAFSYVSALVRKPEVTELDLSTVFILQVITATAVAAILVAISPLVAYLMEHELFIPVLSIMSLNVILLIFQGVPNVVLQRKMDFKSIAKAVVIEIAAFGVVAIYMAMNDYGVWSLVVGRVAGRAASVVAMMFFAQWVPTIKYSKQSAKAILGISTQFAGKEVLNDISKNIAYLFTGWAQGVTNLGFYSRAHYVMTLPVDRISRSLEKVLFPAFSQMQDDYDRLRKAFIKANCLMAVVVCPVLVGLALAAPAFIVLLYGEKWQPSVAPLQVLSFAGIFYALESPAVALINAMGFIMSEINRQLLHIFLIVVCISIGNTYGLQGIAWGVVAATSVYWLLLLILLKNRLQLSRLQYLVSLIPALVSTILMAASVLLVQHLILSSYPLVSVVNLSATIVTGVISYTAAIYVFTLFGKSTAWADAMLDLRDSVFSVLRRIPLVRRIA